MKLIIPSISAWIEKPNDLAKNAAIDGLLILTGCEIMLMTGILSSVLSLLLKLIRVIRGITALLPYPPANKQTM